MSLGAVTVPAATRVLNGGFTLTEPLFVEIWVMLKAGASVCAVQDQIPERWSVREIGQGGTFDSAERRVKWGPFFDNAPRTFRYQASREPESTAAGEFVGVVSLDGVSISISGPRRVSGRISLGPFVRLSEGRFRLGLLGQADAEYAVELSSDLNHWTPLATATNSHGAVLFADPGSIRLPWRFYRLVGRQ